MISLSTGTSTRIYDSSTLRGELMRLFSRFGVMTSVLGSKLRWWIDPMGSILLSVLIAFLWLRTARSEFLLLIGVSADTPTLQLITYICKSCLLLPAPLSLLHL